MKVTSIIEDVLIGVGIAVSISDIQQVLSIILLVFNVCWILFKFGYKIYERIKNKQIKEIGDDIKETHDELETLSDSLKDSEQEKEDK